MGQYASTRKFLLASALLCRALPPCMPVSLSPRCLSAPIRACLRPWEREWASGQVIAK